MKTAQVTISRGTFKKTKIKSGWKSFFSSWKTLSSSLSNQRNKCLRFYLCNHKFLLGFWWRCASVALIFYDIKSIDNGDNGSDNNKEPLKILFKLNRDWIANTQTNIRNINTLAEKKIRIVAHQRCFGRQAPHTEPKCNVQIHARVMLVCNGPHTRQKQTRAYGL